MSTDKPTVPLAVYLAKEDYPTVDDVLKEDATYTAYSIDGGGQKSATLLIAASHSNLPKWASLFSHVVSPEDIGRNQATGALLAVTSKGRFFLYSFGQGRHLIAHEAIERNFGLRCALNLLDPESIRSLDKSSLESQPKQAREQSGEAVGLDFFGIDIESDLLRGITGRPKSAKFGSRVSGGDPVRLSLPIESNEFCDLSEQLYQAYQDDSYKHGPFSWIDHISEVKDKTKQNHLDALLIEKLNEKKFDNIWLCAPRIIEWDRVAGFLYSRGKKATQYYDTRISECLDVIVKSELDIALLKRRKITAVDDDGKPAFSDSVYRFVYAEIDDGDATYILSAGSWYSITPDYVSRIHDEFESIKEKQYPRELLEFDDENEEEYNIRLSSSNPHEFALLDKKNVVLPEAVSPIEICDVYRHQKELIHVKRYGGSSVLSHLFNQGLVSGELLQRARQYRSEINARLPAHLQIDNIETRPSPNEYTVVFAIISEQEEGLSIPFFSKISLKHAVNRLEAYGHKVQLAKIPVAEMKKKTQKLPPQ